VSHSQQPQISPISRLSFIPSENKEDDSTNKNAQNGMDSKINPSEEAVDQYFKKLEQEHPKEVANFLAKYLSLEKLCLALPYIVTMATDKADANPRILAANECLAVATAYFNVAFACTFNDPNGKKKNRKNLEASKKSKVEMLRESKFIKPKDLQVFQPYLKNRKKKKKR
jgi:hypothetical protein